MEVSENLRPQTTALKYPNLNPEAGQLFKQREEGELSSEEEQHMPSRLHEDQVLLELPWNGVDGASGSALVPPGNKDTKDVHVGAVGIQSQAQMQPVSQKSSEKNWRPSKANNPGWSAPGGAANNLVIRFSDDSSGSDSEEHIEERAAKSKANSNRGSGTQNSLPPLRSNTNKQKSAVSAAVTPQRFSLNPALTSTTKVPGSSSGGGRGSLSVEQGPMVKNIKSLVKNMSNRESVSDRNMDLNSNKLQDLRQQIALRESELKLKSVQRNKEYVPSAGDNATISLNTNAAKRFTATSSSKAIVEPKEPEKKRMKVSGSFSTQLKSVNSQEDFVGKSTLPWKEPAMPISGSAKLDQRSKWNSTGRTETNTEKRQMQNEKRVPCLSENISPRLKSGCKSASNRIQSDENRKQIDGSNQPTASANMNSQLSLMNANIMELNPHKNQQSSFFSNKENSGKDPLQDSHPEIINNKRLQPLLGNMGQESESRWNCLNNSNVVEHRSMNMQSLAEMEESIDKALDEAQELRRSCEIEERNALKAYRKAQRSLVEANVKCADLYHKREMYSAQLRSFIMGDPSLLCSSRKNDKLEIGYSDDISRDMLFCPLSQQLQPERGHFNGIEMGSNFHDLDVPPVKKSHKLVNGQTVGSEQCCEPDASTSEPLPNRGKSTTADGFCSPPIDRNVSVNEDDGSSAFQNGLEICSQNNNFDDDENNLTKESNRDLTTDKPADLMLLEATLRSELFARLRTRNSLKNSSSSDDIHLNLDQRTENHVSTEKNPENLENSLPSNSQAGSEGGGPEGREPSYSEAHVEMEDDCAIETDCLDSRALSDPGKEGSCISISDVLMSNIFRSAFSHLKIISPKTFMKCVSKNGQKDSGYANDKLWCHNPRAELSCENNVELCKSKDGSYTCDIPVDPFWPLCMYELRGKCNNDECPWQHVRDNKVISRVQHTYADADVKVHRYSDAMATPKYLVDFDSLMVDLPSYKSIVACRNEQGWKKCFSLSLTLSNLFLRDLPVHGPPSGGSEGRIEVHSSWGSRRSSDLMSRSDRLVSNQLTQPVADNEQALETAILIFSQEVFFEGMKKALPILSRALEADPTTVYLWILYLVIYHSNAKSMVADDMLSCAVQYNGGSYEVWLIYINSRIHVDDQLATYEAALRALCSDTSSSNRDRIHASACILDLFLQMIECSCMSANAEKAIQKVVELCSAERNSDKPLPILSDFLSCLTMSDKCIFWVCCVYFVVYKKLPEVVVRQFECDKELPEIEWLSVLLEDSEKQRALELMEKGAEYVASSLMQTESLISGADLSSAQSFSVNHIRCTAAIDSPECCSNLLRKYLRLYPSCLELVLMSARAQKRDFEEVSFLGFEQTLGNWPKETPGIQCIWNQYAQLFLRNGQFEFGKELMDRWYRFAWTGNDQNDGFLASDSKLEANLRLNQIDSVFGFLNLSLYKLLQNDRIGARIAVDKALRAASPNTNYLKYCIKEHAMFFLTEESLMEENASIGNIVSILKYHMGDCHINSATEPLPRKFINSIKKPRVQQLVSNIFSPLSADCSLVNLVLEVWFGPSLLPEEFAEPTYLVDFVERILYTWPSNYELALSLCKLLISRKTSTGMLYWASSTLMGAISDAVPIPPEHAWVEVARVLGKAAGIDDICLRFYRRALTAYPFSFGLWRSRQSFHMKMGGDVKTITEEAKAKGIDLD